MRSESRLVEIKINNLEYMYMYNSFRLFVSCTIMSLRSKPSSALYLSSGYYNHHAVIKSYFTT